MSEITRLDDFKVDHEIMEPYLSGDDLYYREEQVTSCAFRCDGCGLIWAKKWYAATCESRDHRSSFDQVYHYRPEGFQTHGKYAEQRYTRYALGRDKRHGVFEARPENLAGSDGVYTVEASTLGLAPGRWPKKISLDGVVVTAAARKANADGELESVIYRNPTVTVTVFND